MSHARSLLLTLAVVGACLDGQAQRPAKPLFPGAELLDTCVVDLPLTYATKDKERYTQAARFLEDVELVYLRYDKRTGKADALRVYVVVETAKDGSAYVYIERSEDHLRMGGAKEALFPKFKPSTERFYNADCFDQRIAAHPELKERVLMP